MVVSVHLRHLVFAQNQNLDLKSAIAITKNWKWPFKKLKKERNLWFGLLLTVSIGSVIIGQKHIFYAYKNLSHKQNVPKWNTHRIAL